MSEKKCGTDDNCTIFSLSWKKSKDSGSRCNEVPKRYQNQVSCLKTNDYARTLVDLVDSRIVSALKENEISLSKDKVDVLVIGHGSMDPNAGISINYIVDELRKSYKNVDRCYLEIEEPNIEQGIQSCQNNSPDVLVIVFYFLHEGAHVKTDINNDLKPALKKSNLKKVCVTKHLGADEKMIDLIVERAKEVENAN